jgi:hypothetical protein
MKNDWNKGNESMMTSMERLMCHQEWLKKQHKDVRDKILSKNKVEEQPVIGFIRD